MKTSIRALCVLISCFAASAVQAENWPSRLIRAVIPFGAGSATDVVPRLVFDRIAIELGQPIVVENRPGAGGTIGTAAVAKAEPDGYTIMGHSSALVIAPSIFTNVAYDVTKDLSSALMIGYLANVMIVPLSRPWNSIQDFLADARKKDAQISYGSVGIGSAVHISAEKFRLAAGFEATHIPYRGGSEVIADILGGRIDFYFCPLATALPLIREGQVKALVVAAAKRAPDLPEVPIPADVGIKDADSAIWIGVFAPSKTPREIVEKLHSAGEKVLADPGIQASLKKMGVEAAPMTTREMDDLIARDAAANAELIKAAGIKQ